MSLISTCKKTKVYFSQRGDKCDEKARRSIFKNHKNCSPLRLGVRSRQKQVRALLKSNVAIECSECSSPGEQFLRFSKNYLSGFHHIFLLFDARNSCIFQIFLLRSIKAYLCPNIIKFDRSFLLPGDIVTA